MFTFTSIIEERLASVFGVEVNQHLSVKMEALVTTYTASQLFNTAVDV
jgi:hypothetical protein